MAIDTFPEGLVYDLPSAIVEIKTHLDEALWSALPNFYCDKLTLAVNAYDEALISYELGDVMQPGTAAFDTYQPIYMLGRYVRITIPPTATRVEFVWVGFVVATANERSAVKVEGAGKVLTGRKQILRVVGLEYFLDRRQIDAAVIAGVTPTTIQRPIPFNKGRGAPLDADTSTRANRSPNGHAVPGVTIYEFVEHGETPELWTIARAINYLLHYFQTVNSDGEPEPTRFILDPQDQIDAVIDGISPSLDPEGMTVFQCLNKLLSPQRGFVWWSEFDDAVDGTHKVRIRVETIAESAVSLPSLGTIPANRDQQSLDLEAQRDIEELVVTEFGSRIYHQVIARGARMTSTVTLGQIGSFNDIELTHDWDSLDLQDEYDVADGGTAEENDAFRSAERFYRVYNAFRISHLWDGKSSNGIDDATRDWSFPVLSDSGSVLSSQTFNVDGLKILNHTRLKRGWNYQDATDIEVTTPDGTEAEYMPPFAIVKVADGATSPEPLPDKYQFVDKLSRMEFGDDSTPVADISTSYHVMVQQTSPGILLRPVGGGNANHAMALNHWDELNLTAHQPEVDYATLRLTCTLEADSYCEARYPNLPPVGVPLQQLIIYVGDEYRLDFLAENTVVDLVKGVPVLTNGGVLRDDRKQLQDIARVAWEWYRQERQPITVSFRQLLNAFRLGMMITTIGGGTPQVMCNTVVSQITFDLLNGTTTVQTQDEGLDFTALV